MVSDTCNYVCTEILSLKTLAADSIGAGVMIKGGSTSGFAPGASGDTNNVGAMAMEKADTAGVYFTTMWIGTAFFKAADTVPYGEGAIISDTGVIDCVSADSGQAALGTILDGETDSAKISTRYHRVFIMGEPALGSSVWHG